MIKTTLALLAGCVFSLSAVAQAPGTITRTSKYPVAESMDRIEAAVKAANGFQVFSRIDFQALAATQGGKVRPAQLLLFGRGTILQPLLPQHPLTAIDLPLKVLVWEAEDGKVMLTYNTGEYLAQRHGVTGKDDLFKRVTDATASFVKNAAESQ